MAYSRPDVYIEEILNAEPVNAGVSTAVPAFLGVTESGPANTPILINSIEEFKRVFGKALLTEPLFYSVRSFFQNGGSSCYVVRLVSQSATTGVSPSATPRSVSINSSASTPTPLMKVRAGYRGVFSYGDTLNDLAVSISLSSRFVSKYVAGSSNDLAADAVSGDLLIKLKSITGIVAGATLKITTDVGGAATATFVKVASTESIIESGALTHIVNLSSALSAALTASDSKVEVMEYDLTVYKASEPVESWRYLSMDPDADLYIETVINDSETGSRFITVEDLLPTSAMSLKVVSSTDLSAASLSLSLGGGNEVLGLVVSDIVGSESNPIGLQSLAARENINLLCVPPSLESGVITSAMLPQIHAAMLDFCGSRMNMFAILDTPAGLLPTASGGGSVGQFRTDTLGADSFWGALYFPHIVVQKEGNRRSRVTVPPSGAVAGLFARNDAAPLPSGSIASAPAGYGDRGMIKGAIGLESVVGETAHGHLNLLGVNCMRRIITESGLPEFNLLGARTLSSTSDFRYVNVRRMLTFIEQSSKRIARPYLFAANGPQTWDSLNSQLKNFLSSLFRAGQLAGNSEAQAFFVKIDASNNTPEKMRDGIMSVDVGVALLRPAEFIVFTFQQSASNGFNVQE
jgi:uncharacterized protein